MIILISFYRKAILDGPEKCYNLMRSWTDLLAQKPAHYEPECGNKQDQGRLHSTIYCTFYKRMRFCVFQTVQTKTKMYLKLKALQTSCLIRTNGVFDTHFSDQLSWQASRQVPKLVAFFKRHGNIQIESDKEEA